MPTASTNKNKADQILRQIVRWIQRIFGVKQQKYQPQKILKEYSSSLTRLLLIERDTPRAVRTWRSVPKNLEHDLLLTCDHLAHVAGERLIEKEHSRATHRIAVLRMSRIPGAKGNKKIIPVWGGDFDMVGSGAGSMDTNRYAIVITDALAKQLLEVPDEEIDWAWEIQHYLKQYVDVTAFTSSSTPKPPTSDPNTTQLQGTKVSSATKQQNLSSKPTTELQSSKTLI